MRTSHRVLFYIVIALAGTLGWNVYGKFQSSALNVSFSQFLRNVDSGQVTAISISGDHVVGVNTQTGRFRTDTPRGYVGWVNRLIERDVDVSVAPEGWWSRGSAPWLLMFIVIQAGMFASLRGYVRRVVRISSTA